jgi:hypothetical protein
MGQTQVFKQREKKASPLRERSRLVCVDNAKSFVYLPFKVKAETGCEIPEIGCEASLFRSSLECSATTHAKGNL